MKIINHKSNNSFFEATKFLKLKKLKENFWKYSTYALAGASVLATSTGVLDVNFSLVGNDYAFISTNVINFITGLQQNPQSFIIFIIPALFTYFKYRKAHIEFEYQSFLVASDKENIEQINRLKQENEQKFVYKQKENLKSKLPKISKSNGKEII